MLAMSEALQYFASTQSRIEQATAGLPEEAKKQRMHPGGEGIIFPGKALQRAQLSFFSILFLSLSFSFLVCTNGS